MGRQNSLSGVTLDTRLTWLPHIDQVRKRTAQRMGMLGPLLNRKSDLSVRKGVLLYKKLIRPMMDYACPAWRTAAHSHVWRLQVLQSKCLHLATGAPWYISNRQIHKDLGVPTVCLPHQCPDCELWLKVSWHGEPSFTATWQILMLTEGWPRCLTRESRAAGANRPVEAIAHDGQVNQINRIRRWSAECFSATLTEVFRDFPQL